MCTCKGGTTDTSVFFDVHPIDIFPFLCYNIEKEWTMETKDKFNLTLPRRVKRRIKAISDDKGISMTDVILEAIKDYIDRQDADYSAPDMVLDRMSQLFMSQMAILQEMEQLRAKVEEIDERI